MTAFVGLGSNRGDRLEYLKQAVRIMQREGIRVIRASSVYETDPVGPPQPDFLNAVCEVSTELPPRELYESLKRIEAEVGRRPGPRWGPREIDLDLLLYDDETVEEPDLVLPHPDLTRRDFVLAPLLEIRPDATLPGGQPLERFLGSREGVRQHASPEALYAPG
ncbi:MAG: 2-amino-4-hydroxy-6-hydroxymethyldihydropteridine diphosphokinase [Actinomycetota bacterium]